MKGERAKEGGRRKRLALEQIPAFLRLTEAKSQSVPSAKEASPQGPKLRCQSPSQLPGVVIFSQHRAVLFVCLTEFKLSSLPGAPILFILLHLLWFTHWCFPPGSYRHSRCLSQPRILMVLECCPAILRNECVITCCYIVTWPRKEELY